VAPEHTKGIGYVESFNRHSVENAIACLTLFNSSAEIKALPIEESTGDIKPMKRKEKLQ